MNKLQQILEKTLGTDKHESTRVGDIATQATDGENLVEGKQTWEIAEEKKDDLEAMMKACTAEIKQMGATGMVAAPFYFERVAILARKEKNYLIETRVCERYIEAIEAFYEHAATPEMVDVRKGPRYKAIVKRLPKAQSLLAKQQANN